MPPTPFFFQEFELYPNKSGTVYDLLEEARLKVEPSEESSGQFRLLEIVSCKINHIIPSDIILECLNPAGTKSYRVEEVPKDQAKLEPNEFLLPVAHFQKESYQTFGVPFLLKVKNVSVPFLFRRFFNYCSLSLF